MVHEPEKSDPSTVALKPANNPNGLGAESVERREGAEGNTNKDRMRRTPSRVSMSSGLERVRERAKAEKKERFTALLHHVDVDLLRAAFSRLKRDAAPGVDGLTWRQYEQNLEVNLVDLHARVHRGAYRAQPSRRKFIPKEDGRERPLGIASLEDKIVQRAVVEVFNAIYEEDFLGFSYGFRPGRGQHDALDALAVGITQTKVNWIVDIDVRSFFDTVSHEWLIRSVEHRIADGRMIRLIRKWLKAGVMDDGEWSSSEAGTPQGAVISPLLSNVYLHFLLDLWFEKKIKPACRGEAYLVRFADDFVATFQYREDVDRFQRQVRERFAEFGLELAEEKTRGILFGRFAAITRLRYGQGRPETFEFLGFKHVCGVDRSGRFALFRIPSVKSCRKFLIRTREWIFEHRHWRRWEQQQHLTRMLRGFYQYFALHHCERKLSWVRQQVQRQWISALNRRGQRRKTNWTRLRACPWFELPWAENLHPMV